MKILAVFGVLAVIGGVIIAVFSQNALLPPRRFAVYEEASIVADRVGHAQLGPTLGSGLIILGVAALVAVIVMHLTRRRRRAV